MASMTFHSASPVREESVSTTTLTPSVQLGTRAYFAGEEYVYCYNAGGATTGTGRCVKLVTGASGYSVAATALTDVFNPFIGVVKHTALAAAEYGWVMTRGFATVKFVSGISAAGDYVACAMGEDGYLIQASGTTVLGTAAVVAYALATPAPDASGTVYAFIPGRG